MRPVRHRFSHLLLGLCLAFPLIHVRASNSVELQAVREPLDAVPVNFPMDLANILKKTSISQVPHPDTPVLAVSPENPLGIAAAIDADRVTGVTMLRQGEYTFLLSLQQASRLNTIALTGDLKGVRATVQITDSAMNPKDPGWETVLTDKDLSSPVSTLQFRGRSAYLAMITLKVPNASSVEHPYILRDIGLYAAGEDVRAFKLEPNSPSTQTTSFVKKDASPLAEGTLSKDSKSQAGSDQSSNLPRADLLNVGSMYAGSRVAYVSSKNAADEANHLNDDMAQTAMTFDPHERESVAVIDFGSGGRRLNKVSVVHSQKPGQMKFYAVNALPWENSKTTVAQLAWFPVHPADLETASDVPTLPLLALANNRPAKKGSAETWSVSPSIFDTLPELGSCDTDGTNFSEVVGSMMTARYLIVRFLNGDPQSGEGFRINDINCFGDATIEDFHLKRIDPLNAQTDTSSFLTPASHSSIAGPNFSQEGLNTAGQVLPSPPSPPPTPASP